MNTKSLIATAFTLIAAGSAMAQEATPDYPTPFTSTVTRAEVRQALFEARAAGLIAQGESNVVAEPVGTPKTRAQVVAETREAIRLGLVGGGERNIVYTQDQIDSIRTAGLKAVPMDVAAR